MAAAYQPGMQAPSGVVSGYPAAPPYPQHSYMPASHSQPLPPAAQHSGYWSMPPAYSYPQPGYGGGAYPPPYPGMPPPVGALPPPQPGQYGPQGRRFGGGMGAGGAAMMGAGAGLLGGLLIADAMTPDCMGGCDMGGGMDVGGGF
ncbi:hypothetical protein COHA_008960 [Chlorella ohadii]|uniref:Uncharacterized protein n=1 Tax=Chlorella ohadii TaxID=2649997 RepID=A0AAD5DJ76_9CHLO|nr:hypothetical protein COHA_008960 [Chlorella ohadii]